MIGIFLVCGKRPLAITAMNAELLPFKNGEHNSESASTIDRVIAPLMIDILFRLTTILIYIFSLAGMLAVTFTLYLEKTWVMYITAGMLG